MFNNGGDEVYRAAIALPHKTDYYDASIYGYDRLASPVIFKIINIEDKFIPIVIFLKDRFIPEGTTVSLAKNRQNKKVTLSHDLLNEMMDENSDLWKDAKCLYEV